MSPIEILISISSPLLVISLTITLFVSTVMNKPLVERLGVAVYSQLLILLVFNIWNVLSTISGSGQFISVSTSILYMGAFILSIIGIVRSRRKVSPDTEMTEK